MSAASSGWAAGLLLVILGTWVLLQTLVGNLAGRVLGLGTNTGAGPTNLGTLGGAGQNAGGPKIGQTTTPSQRQKIANSLGLPAGGNTPATLLPAFNGPATPGALA